MNPNANILRVNNNPTGVADTELARTLVLAGQEPVQDLVRQATLSVQQTLSEMRELIQKCEAELEIREDINVIIERDRVVFSMKRMTRFAKDKP